MLRRFFLHILLLNCLILLFFTHHFINCADSKYNQHYNQKCVTDDDCGDTNGYCDRNRNKCACGDNYSVDLSRNKCVRHSKKLNENCATDAECDAINAYCSTRNKVCVCKPGSAPIGDNRDQCSVSIRPFDRKRYDERCELFGCDIEQNLRCLYFRCKCVYDYEYKNGQCVQKINRSSDNTITNSYNNNDNNSSVFGTKGNVFIYITVFSVIVIIALCLAFVHAMRNERTPHTAPYYRQNNNNNNANLYRNTRLRQSGGNSSTSRGISNNFDRIRVANTSATGGNCDQRSVNTEINGGVIATAPQAEAAPFGSTSGESRFCFDSSSNYGDKPPSYADAIRIFK